MTALTVHPPRDVAGGLAGFARGLVDFFVRNSEAMRCSREAERLFNLSDAELARLGIARDDIVRHAFQRFLAS